MAEFPLITCGIFLYVFYAVTAILIPLEDMREWGGYFNSAAELWAHLKGRKNLFDAEDVLTT